MKIQFSFLQNFAIRIIWIAILLVLTTLVSHYYPTKAQTTDWALQFDGTTDSVYLGKTKDIIVGSWETTKTINLWVNPPSINECDGADPSSCDAIFGDKPRWWGITIGLIPWGHHAGQDNIWVRNFSQKQDYIGIPYTPNEWVNITLVHDNFVLRAYKNGVLAGSMVSGATYQSTDYAELFLGGITTGPEGVTTFGGLIDEVQIWNVALSESEIISSMYGLEGNEPGLMAYYKMSDGPTTPPDPPRTTLTDDSGHGWTGTLMDGDPPGVPGNNLLPVWVEHFTFTPPARPADPSNLSAIAVSFYQVGLSWSDTSDNEFCFEIERCTGISCTDFSLLDTLLDSPGVGVVTYTDTNVSFGSTYCYRVRAANTGGSSEYTNPPACTTIPFPIFLPTITRG